MANAIVSCTSVRIGLSNYLPVGLSKACLEIKFKEKLLNGENKLRRRSIPQIEVNFYMPNGHVQVAIV